MRTFSLLVEAPRMREYKYNYVMRYKTLCSDVRLPSAMARKFLFRLSSWDKRCVNEPAYVSPSFGDTIRGMRSPPLSVRPLPHGVSLPVTTLRLAHQKILENQIPFEAGEWSTATAALYFSLNRVGSGFHFDHAIERVAVRAMERGWLVRGHDTPPTLSVIGDHIRFPFARWQIASC